MPQIGPFLIASAKALSTSSLLLAAGKIVAFQAISQTLTRRMGTSRQPIEGMLNNEMTSLAESKIVYGEIRVGGSIVYANTTPVYTLETREEPPARGVFRVFENSNDDLLHFVIEIASHPCHSIDDVYVDDTALNIQVYNGLEDFSIVSRVFPSMRGYPNSTSTDDRGVTRYLPADNNTYKKYVMVKKYTGAQTEADIDLMDATSLILDTAQRWTADCVGRDKTYCYVRMGFKPGLFGSFPRLSFKVKGKSTIYDPRDTNYKYTDNPALCLADYLTTSKEQGGRGIAWEDIDVDSVKTAANICDQVVPVYEDGTTEKRYRLGGRASTGENPSEVIQDMLAAMSGWMEKINGKWHISAGAYTPPLMTLTESEFRGRPEVSLNQPMNRVVNEIRPVIRSELTSWEPGPGEGVMGIQRLNVTANPTTDRLTAASHGVPEGGRVRIRSWSSGAFNDDNIPSGLVAAGWYYAVNVTTNDFQVSLTKGGAAVNFTTAGTGQIVAEYDRFLTEDGERITIDLVLPYVNDVTQARRLARIALLQSRNEVSARVFCKLGTPFAKPFNLKVGSSVRWIDAYKGFWEYTAAEVACTSNASGGLDAIAHGLDNGEPIVFTDTEDGTPMLTPFYVVNATSDTFQIAEYRGGSPVPLVEGFSYIYRAIQGKLFRVIDWALAVEGLAIGIDLGLVATTPDLYTWDNLYEVVPSSNTAITVNKVFDVGAPDNFTVESGTNILYIRNDGTIGSRARLTWDETTSSYVARAGKVEIEYKQTDLTPFTVDYLVDDELFNATGHGLSQGDLVNLRTTGTLPAGIDPTRTYIVASATTNTFKLSIDGSDSYLSFTDNGSGTHSVDEQMTWQSWGSVAGISTEAFISDLEDGVDYDFRIRFVNSFGASSEWAYVLSHTLVGKTAAPNPVTSLTATTTFKDRIDVSWTPPSDKDVKEIWVVIDDGATVSNRYVTSSSGVYRDEDSVGTEGSVPYTGWGSSVAAVSSVSPTDVTYDLYAKDTSGNFSTVATATGSMAIPSAPTNLALSRDANGEINLTWTPSISDEVLGVELWFDTGAVPGVLYGGSLEFPARTGSAPYPYIGPGNTPDKAQWIVAAFGNKNLKGTWYGPSAVASIPDA